MSDFEDYLKHFPAGLKILAGIPMQNNELFRDGAVILEIEEDIVTVQLSRDVLPAGVDLQTGKTLELRGGKEGHGYRCSANLVSTGNEGRIVAQLTGSVNSSEMREFYRIDAFLPIKFEVCKDQHLDIVLSQWRKRREQHAVNELERKEILANVNRQRLFKVVEGESGSNEDQRNAKIAQEEAEDFDIMYPSWSNVDAAALNISGGGFKIVTPERLKNGELVQFEIFIPGKPPRVMDCITRVVFLNRNYFFKGPAEYFNVAFQFMFLDERDRDAIVSHISNLQLIRLNMSHKRSLMGGKVNVNGSAKRISFSSILIGVLLLLALLAGISIYFKSYLGGHDKNDIEKNFEDSLKIYRNQ